VESAAKAMSLHAALRAAILEWMVRADTESLSQAQAGLRLSNAGLEAGDGRAEGE
jgi:hypothetical protein